MELGDLHPAVARLFRRANIQQHTEEWYDKRGKMLTASDVATTLHVNPYQSRTRLLLQKLVQQPPAFALGDELVEKLKKPNNTGNFMTTYGNAMEDVAARRYEETRGCKSLSFGLFVHPEHEWLGASPDRVTCDGTLVEIKCPVLRTITAEVPVYYYPQIQVLLEVLDLEACDFVQFRPETAWVNEELVVTRVPRDRAWFERELPRMRSFYDDWMSIKRDPDEYYAFVRDHAPKPRASRKRAPDSPGEPPVYPFLAPEETNVCWHSLNEIASE